MQTIDSTVQQKPASSTISSWDDDENEVGTTTKEITSIGEQTVETIVSSPEPELLKPSTSKASVSSSNDIHKTVGQINTPIVRSAEQVTKKLIHQLASMDKHNLKQMIINPNSKFDTVLQTQARKKLREEMRKQLRNMNLDNDNQLLQNMLEPDECIDSDKIPEAVFDEIGRVLDINLLGTDFSSSIGIDRCDEDGNPNNTKEDLYLRAEKLLMENSTFLLEERLNDTSIINSVSNSPTCEQSDVLESDQTRSKVETQTQNNTVNFINETKSNPNDKLNFDDHFIDILDEANTIDPNVSLPKLHNLTTIVSNNQVVDNHAITDSENIFEKSAITYQTHIEKLNNFKTESQSENELKIHQSAPLLKRQSSSKTEKQKETISTVLQDKSRPQLEGDCDSLDSVPKKLDLITKLRNLDAMKSSAAEKKSKKLSIQSVRSSKSSKSKKHKRLKEKRKEKLKSHREKNHSGRSHHRSSSSSSSSSSSNNRSSSSDDDSSKLSKKTKKPKKSFQLKHVKPKKKSGQKTEHGASVNDYSDLVARRKVENVNISHALTYNNETEKMVHLETVPSSNEIKAVTQDDTKLSNDKERFRATLEALKTEGDDDECKEIIQNIEQLIDDEFQKVDECSENVLPASKNICHNVKSVIPLSENNSENSKTIEMNENTEENISSVPKSPEQQIVSKLNDAKFESEIKSQNSSGGTNETTDSSNLNNQSELMVSNEDMGIQPTATTQSDKITILQNVTGSAEELAETNEVNLQIPGKTETTEPIIFDTSTQINATTEEIENNTQALIEMNAENPTQSPKPPIADTLSKLGNAITKDNADSGKSPINDKVSKPLHTLLIDVTSKTEPLVSQCSDSNVFPETSPTNSAVVVDIKNQIIVESVLLCSSDMNSSSAPTEIGNISELYPTPKEPLNEEKIESPISNVQSTDLLTQAIDTCANVAVSTSATRLIDSDLPISKTKRNVAKIENKEDLTKKFKFFGKKPTTKIKDSSSKQVKQSDGANIGSNDHSSQSTGISDTTKKEQKSDKHSSSKTKYEDRFESKSSSSSHKRSRHKHSHDHDQDHEKRRKGNTDKSKDRSKDLKATSGDKKSGIRGKIFNMFQLV